MNFLAYTGLWVQLVTVILYLILLHQDITLPINLKTLLFLSLIPTLYIYGNNAQAKANGKKRFDIGQGLGRSRQMDPRYWSNKHKLQYPDIPKELMGTPEHSLILGKKNGKYIRVKIKDDYTPAHWLVIGGSGSGKSSAHIIPTLLNNDDKLVWAIDIKGELNQLTVDPKNDHIRIVNPTNRDTYGVDVFGTITKNNITEIMQQISHTIVGISHREKDPFWKNSARSMLISCLIYGFKNGKTEFIDIIDWILSKPIKQTVNEVIDNSNQLSPEYKYMVQFKDMADETISGVFSELATHIAIFANDEDLRYCLKFNPNRITPDELKKGNSVYLVIPEEKLTVYGEFTRICVNLTLHEMNTYDGKKPVLFVLDELGRLLSAGKLEALLDAYKTGRSRKIVLVAATQSVEGLNLSDGEIADLVSNNEFISILSAKSSKTMKLIQDWGGKYQERNINWTTMRGYRRASTNYNDKPIIDTSDLITLQQSGEEILISPWGYMRYKKAPWYKDKKLITKVNSIKERRKSYEK